MPLSNWKRNIPKNEQAPDLEGLFDFQHTFSGGSLLLRDFQLQRIVGDVVVVAVEFLV
ncbi:MAG: hypothetical protein RLZZ519_2373 [Bacteroidota bacterium]|jgi:hypothetical protein